MLRFRHGPPREASSQLRPEEPYPKGAVRAKPATHAAKAELNRAVEDEEVVARRIKVTQAPVDAEAESLVKPACSGVALLGRRLDAHLRPAARADALCECLVELLAE